MGGVESDILKAQKLTEGRDAKETFSVHAEVRRRMRIRDSEAGDAKW